MSTKKPLDLVVYGATGFTGKLACEYLAGKSPAFSDSFKWAIAGRDAKKLENLKETLSSRYSHMEKLGIVVADSSDAEALDKLTSQCKALVSFVGPYSKYGTKLIESCVNNCTHYADLTGELFWVLQMMEKLDEKAKANRVKLIPTCGFDSVPSDWGTMSIAKTFKDKLGEDTKHVRGVLWAIKAGFSGGSIASGLEASSPENIGKTISVIKDPQALNPKDRKNGLDSRDPNDVIWDPEVNHYLAPFIMAPINSRIVRRSNAFNGYGQNFAYDEFVKSTWLKGKAMSWGLVFANLSISNTWIRPITQRLVPKPGQGPNEDIQKNGFAKLKFFGSSAESGKKAVCDMTITGDPGYVVTARMLVEAGIDMARESEEMGVFGFRTPCSGLSEKYFEAMLQNGFQVKTDLVDEKNIEE
ncbi:putative trans-acting enoyl reductase Rv2449c [Symsagittifera roscoffensis]|uniref:putative trans-acting enoyl reductase Rv2449c n=1 Tax=Symsagittifera roscoffensis TaxID=84072 RepID=UPI00307C8F25